MVSLRLIQIFTALSLYVESVKGDCTSCPVATLACDPNPGDLNAVNGIFSQTVGNDTNGCMTLTFHCTDDSGAGEFGYIYKDDYFFENGDPITCPSTGVWGPSEQFVLYCVEDAVTPKASTPDPTDVTTAKVPTLGPVDGTTAKVPTSGPVDETTVNVPTTSGSPGGCCNEWSAWTSEDTCSDNCGGCDTLTYTRTCLTESTCPCPGESTKTESCNLNLCPYPRKTCCGSRKAKVAGSQIICLLPNETSIPLPPQTCGCCPDGGIWSAWTDYNCTDTCGGYGTGLRKRVCLSQDIGCPCTGESTKIDSCKLSPCKYPRVSCGPNQKAKVYESQILCLPDTLPAVPQTTCCPAEGLWESWSAWSTCATTCGACSNATRRRYCASSRHGCPCAGSETTQALPCNTYSCSSSPQCCIGSPTIRSDGDPICESVPTGVWGSWASTGCTDTCGYCGTTIQTRTCASGTCVGESTQNTTIPCGPQLCTYGSPNPSCCPPATRGLVGSTISCVLPS